jgi:hypothetical protein
MNISTNSGSAVKRGRICLMTTSFSKPEIERWMAR